MSPQNLAVHTERQRVCFEAESPMPQAGQAVPVHGARIIRLLVMLPSCTTTVIWYMKFSWSDFRLSITHTDICQCRKVMPVLPHVIRSTDNCQTTAAPVRPLVHRSVAPIRFRYLCAANKDVAANMSC